MEMRIFLQTYYRCMKIKIPNFNFYRQVLWFNKENTCRWCFVLLLMSEENKLEAIMNAKWRGRSCVKPSLKKQWTWAANMLFLFEIDYHFCNFESMLHVACCMKPWAETRAIALNFQHCLLWSLSRQMPAFSQKNYRRMSTNEDTWRFFALHRTDFTLESLLPTFSHWWPIERPVAWCHAC